MDPIDRQAAIDALIRKIRPHDNGDGTMTISVMSEGLVRDTLNALPSAQQERKTGKWCKSYADHEAFGVRPFFRYCSCCNEITVHPYKYCPNCGARME